MPTILLISTIESQFAGEIYREFNSLDTITKLYPLYNGDAGIKISFLEKLLQDPNKYPTEFLQAFQTDDFSSIINYLTNNLIDLFVELCTEVYDQQFSKLSDINFENPALLSYVALNKKPIGITHYVGWKINEVDYDYLHPIEHERITLEEAKILVSKHNQWLIDNRDSFDIFFDGNSKEEVFTALKAL